ncbi:hypothetical protein HK405_002762, partial [Cladochytrium tenue]
FVFGEGEVVVVDVAMTPGSTGRTRGRAPAGPGPSGAATPLVRVDPEASTSRLRLQAARSAAAAARRLGRGGAFPVSVRAVCEADARARLGLREALEAGVLVPRPALEVADDDDGTGAGRGAIAARFSLTAVVGAAATARLTGAFEPPFVRSARSLHGRGVLARVLARSLLPPDAAVEALAAAGVGSGVAAAW